MSKFGPSRREHKIRLAICAFGMAMAIFALSFHGIGGIASLEILLISGAFFGGTAFFSIRALLKGDDE